jgi:hypothetical protein
MAMFGSNWKSDNDDYDKGLFSRWRDDDYDNERWSIRKKSTKTTEEILDEIDISEIEKYLRKKKLENIKNNEQKR